MGLTGKVAVVTGAARGIGFAVAEEFAKEGAQVLLVDIDAAAGHAATAAISESGSASFVQADVSSAAAAGRVMESAHTLYGGVDVLVNNAAVVTKGTATSLTESDWNLTLAVNLSGPFLMAKEAIPSMAARGGGVILNMSSITGLVGRRDRVAYCASKGGLIALSRAMAVDHALEGVRVNVICPSGIETRQMAEMHAENPDQEQALAQTLSRHPIGRMALPRELARLLAYLASDDASFITGSVYTFDGGYTAI